MKLRVSGAKQSKFFLLVAAQSASQLAGQLAGQLVGQSAGQLVGQLVGQLNIKTEQVLNCRECFQLWYGTVWSAHCMRLSRKRAKKEWKSDWLPSSAAASLISFTFLSPSCCCCCFYEKVQELYNKNYWLPCFTLNYFFLAILSKKKARKISRVLAKLHDMV